MDDSDIPELRRSIRAHLAERPRIAQSAATTHRHVAREFKATLSDTEDAIAVLVALKQLSKDHDPLGGSTLYYQATADGILAHERGQ